MRARGDQRAYETGRFGSQGDLLEVVEGGQTVGVAACTLVERTGRKVAAVAVGGEVPKIVAGHGRHPTR